MAQRHKRINENVAVVGSIPTLGNELLFTNILLRLVVAQRHKV